MPSPLPICVECNQVITNWNGRANRPIFCSKPNLCRYSYQNRPNPICARPGCRKEFTRAIRSDGQPMSSQRFCDAHQVSDKNFNPCHWCGEPCVDTRDSIQEHSRGKHHTKSQHWPDYCTPEHKMLAWNYPGQPPPICNMCNEEITQWSSMADRYSGRWYGVNDPPNAHHECWANLRADEKILYYSTLKKDLRIKNYAIKILVPEHIKQLRGMNPAMIVKFLQRLELTEEDLVSTASERAKILRDYKQWQKEQPKIGSPRGKKL